MAPTWSKFRTLIRHGSRFYSNNSPFMEVCHEVADALSMGRPVVALETTILTHGMPYPQNRETANCVEDIIRSHNVVPATIGILDGKIHVGLSNVQLDRLSDPNQSKIKVSKRDIPYAISQKLCGGTTVSGTISIAHKVGIPLFVTGGIGGVHREGHISFDISADLIELGTTPIGVVSAGIKSILDIPRTLELLETLGVTVVTYGHSKEFPAFFTAKSNCYVDQNIESPLEGARLLNISNRLSLNSGILIAVPPPSNESNDLSKIEETIQQSLKDAKHKGIIGKAVTPFILDKVNQLTSGQSLLAKLIKNNAQIGSKIAVELSKLRQLSIVRVSHDPVVKATPTPTTPLPVVVGASVVDIVAKVKTTPIKNEGTNNGTITTSYGGVARNIAECMMRNKCPTLLITNIGEDDNGNKLLHFMNSLNMSTKGVQVLPEYSTATYCVVLESDGEVHCGIRDMDIVDQLSVEWVQKFPLTSAPLICIDANIPSHVMEHVCQISQIFGTKIWFEPTCMDKSIKPIKCGVLDKLTYISPNLSELHTISNSLVDSTKREPLKYFLSEKERVEYAEKLSKPLVDCIPHVFVTLGKDGLLYINKKESLYYPPYPKTLPPFSVTNVSGAGDCLAAGIMAGIMNKSSMNEAIIRGLKAAYESLQSTYTVNPSTNGDVTSEWYNIKSKSITSQN